MHIGRPRLIEPALLVATVASASRCQREHDPRQRDSRDLEIDWLSFALRENEKLTGRRAELRIELVSTVCDPPLREGRTIAI
jgi:hypothetical protein